MSAKYEFPEPNEAYWRGPTDYNYGDVQNWFKRCLEDYPHLDKYDVKGDAFPANIIHDRTRWFNKWFSQFRNKSEK